MMASLAMRRRCRWVECLTRPGPAGRIFTLAGHDRTGRTATQYLAGAFLERRMLEWDTFDMDEPPMPSAIVARRVVRTVLLAGMALALVLTVVR